MTPRQPIHDSSSGRDAELDWVEAIGQEWLPPGVLTACSTALHRLGAQSLSSLAVSSALRGDGRTTLTLGAAAVQRYEYGRSVILLDLDFEEPDLAGRVGAAESLGAAEYLRGEAPLAEVVQEVADGLALVAAGSAARGEAPRLLNRIAEGDLMRALATRADVVVADLPPLLPDGLGERVLATFDQTLFVIRAGRTPLPAVREAVGRLPTPPPVLLNEWTTRVPRWLLRATRC